MQSPEPPSEGVQPGRCGHGHSAAATVSTLTAGGTAGGASDVASGVFAAAPVWICASHWHCKHPDAVSEASFIKFNGPYTSSEVLQLYKHQQMKGSNLVVGLTATVVNGRDVPPAFFRTLAYLFELAKRGVAYEAVTEGDLAAGAPRRGWCPPLWLDGDDASDGDVDASVCKASQDTETACGVGGDRGDARLEALLHSCPYWCYLYSHVSHRAKKTPPKTAEQMLTMHRLGSLPEWAPLLGLMPEVATFNSLPPCLFMTLGSLLGSGVPYRPVGVVQLEQWDKFIDSRTASGATQSGITAGGTGTGSGAAAGGHGGGGVAAASPPAILSPARGGGGGGGAPAGGSSRDGGRLSSPGGAPAGPMFYPHAPPGYMPYQPPQPMSPYHTHAPPYMTQNPYMWVGGYLPQSYSPTAHPHPHHQAVPQHPMYLPPGSPAMYAVAGVDMEAGDGALHGSPAGGIDRTSDQGPLRVPPSRAFRTQLSSPGRMNSHVPTPVRAHAVALGTPRQSAAVGQLHSKGRHRHSIAGQQQQNYALHYQQQQQVQHYQQQQQHYQQQQQHAAAEAAGPYGASLARRSGSGSSCSNESAAGALLLRACSPVMEAPRAASRVMPSPRPIASVRWETPVFRLFTADATRGDGHAAWWFVARDGAAQPDGPFSAEAMILAYAGGDIDDGARVAGVRGGHARAPPACRLWPRSMERLGALLEQVQRGAEYELLEAEYM